jgi:hypothetical protein
VEHEEDVEAQCAEVAAVEEVHPEVGVALVLEDVVAEVEEAFREVAVVALLHEAGVAVPLEEVDSEEVGVRSSVSGNWHMAFGYLYTKITGVINGIFQFNHISFLTTRWSILRLCLQD